MITTNIVPPKISNIPVNIETLGLLSITVSPSKPFCIIGVLKNFIMFFFVKVPYFTLTSIKNNRKTSVRKTKMAYLPPKAIQRKRIGSNRKYVRGNLIVVFRLVGDTGLEPVASVTSRLRSSQLS